MHPVQQCPTMISVDGPTAARQFHRDQASPTSMDGNHGQQHIEPRQFSFESSNDLSRRRPIQAMCTIATRIPSPHQRRQQHPTR
ncbi:hypothetical protein ACLOJK_006927 [Asimina triloba]